MSSARVEVVYALPDQEFAAMLEMEPGSTVRDAIVRSGVLDVHPEIDLENSAVGIWSRKVGLDCRVNEGDRVEIYRPLIADPKTVRRQRARRAGNSRRSNRG